jgi:hypothetical protein
VCSTRRRAGGPVVDRGPLLTLAALLIVALVLVLFSWKVLLVLSLAVLLFALLCLYAQHRVEARYAVIDWTLQIAEPSGPVISGPDHPLYCRAGARRGPELPADLPEHTATGRFR